MGLYAVWELSYNDPPQIFTFNLDVCRTVEDISNNAPFYAQIYEASSEEEAIKRYIQENERG